MNAGGPMPASAEVTVARVTEDGRSVLRATVVGGEGPVPNAKVRFLVRRFFGAVEVGSDTTLDDGTAAVPYPASLPGDMDGVLALTAVAEWAGGGRGEGSARIPAARAGGGAGVGTPSLWGPRAPVPLKVTFASVLGAVLGAYAFAVVQILNVRFKEPSSGQDC